MKSCAIVLLLIFCGCVSTVTPDPQRVMEIQNEPQRGPDLYLTDGTPCWYLRKEQFHRSRLLCDLEEK